MQDAKLLYCTKVLREINLVPCCPTKIVQAPSPVARHLQSNGPPRHEHQSTRLLVLAVENKPVAFLPSTAPVKDQEKTTSTILDVRGLLSAI